jgi:hypothetical protein
VDTDCDRLDRAFAALRVRHIIALHEAGDCQEDGFELCDAAFGCLTKPEQAEIIGYCFYHRQDTTRAIEGAGIGLTYCPIGPIQSDGDAEGIALDQCICNELVQAGLTVVWSGDFKDRILVIPFDGKRRRT